MKWMKKHPYLSVTLGCLLLMILAALLGGGFRLPLPNPEVLGRLIGIVWMISMVGIMFIRAIRK